MLCCLPSHSITVSLHSCVGSDGDDATERSDSPSALNVGGRQRQG